MEAIDSIMEVLADEAPVVPIHGSSKPPPPHVPPRIDPDMYQADVPDWCPEREDSATALPDSGLHSKSVYSAEYSSSPEIREFLVVVRNLLDPVRPKGQQFWVASQSAVPLETDVMALEYLASYDYDVEKALFNLYCELGRGKDAVFTQKAVAMTERTASNVIFSDCKDRLLRVAPQALFGAYYAALNHGRLPNADSNAHSSSNPASAAYAAAAAFGGAIVGLAGILSSSHDNSHGAASSTAGGGNSNKPAQQHVIFSSIISHPMQQADCERLLSAAARLSSSGDLLIQNESSSKTHKPVSISAGSRKKDSKTKLLTLPDEPSVAVGSSVSADLITASSAHGSSAGGAVSGGEEEEVVIPRVSKPRGASSDKVELRKKWLAVAQKAAALLGQTSSTTSTNDSKQRGTLVAAQALLEHACSLPPYSNMSFSGSAVVSSTHAANMSISAVAAAQEETALLDGVGVLLGKLVKATVAARFWVSEVRDAIYCSSLDAVIYSGQTGDMKTKNGTKKGNAESLMNGLRELLKESEALPVYAEAEERQLRETIASTKHLLETSRAVLKECCAWESNAQSVQALVQFEGALPVENTHKYARVVRGRPEVYTPGVVRSLLQAHINQNAETTTFEASPVEKRPSMEEVGELLALASKNPVKISEMAYLQDLHRRGLQLVDSASTILVRAAQLSVAKSRLTLDRVRYTVAEVQALLRSMHSFPFRSAEVDALQALVLRAEAWRREVVAMSGGLLVNESDVNLEGGAGKTAQNSRSSTSRRSDAASAASNKPIPLKKVEALIAEGERFPFEFKDELEVLRDKKDLAKVWLEKLKRSFVPTKVASGRGKKGSEENGNGAAAKSEKLSLSDMKMMVSEGESLYQQPLEDDADLSFGGLSGAPVSLLGRPAASSRTVNRELDRAQAVVETAEDWISRVRDLLAGGSGGDEEGSESSAHQDSSSSNADGEGEEESEEEDPERTMQVLRAMLDEAESMPVTLDECGLLRCHLQALEWAAKVRPVLASAEAPVVEEPVVPVTAATTATTEEAPQADEMQGEEEKVAPTTTTSSKRSRDRESRETKSSSSNSNKSTRSNGKPRLAEMQQYAKEITKIRATAGSASSGSEIPLKALPEEVKVLGLVADAERWLNKAKKLMHGSSIRKGTKLSRLRLLHDEGASLPIHFDAELRPLKAAISTAEQWSQEHKAVLEGLGITDRDSEATEDAENEDGEAENAVKKEETVVMSENQILSNGTAAVTVAPPTVSYREFARIVASAAQLVADFSLVRSVQSLHAEVERWVQKAHKVCGTTPAPISTEEEADENAAAAASETTTARSTKRRKIASEEAESVEAESVDESASTTPAAATTAAAAAKSAAAKSQPMIPLAQLESLIEEGRSFRLDLSEQVALLNQVKAHAEGWERSAVQYISTQFSDSLKKVFIEYKRLITDYTAPENGAIFPFMQRKPSAQSSHSVAKGYKEEAVAQQKLQLLLTEVLAVRTVGERIGVEMPFHRSILVYIRLLEWVQETRNVACFLNSSRRPAGNSANPKKGAALESFGGWEDLKELSACKNWGDVNDEYILALIAESNSMLSSLYSLDADEKMAGILVHYGKGLLASAAEYKDVVEEEPQEEAEDEAMDTGDEQEQNEDIQDGDHESGAEEDAEADHDGSAQDHVEGTSTTPSASKKRPISSSSSSARKRKSAPVESSNSPLASKSTRAASGITKKKIDTDFAETVNLAHVHTANSHHAAKGSANKRQKTSATSASTSNRAAAAVKNEEVQSEVVVEPPKPPAVDLDLARTARRAAVSAFLELPDARAAKLSPAMAHMLDMWTRVLKIFALRLRVSKAWAKEAQRLVGGLRITDGAIFAVENEGNTVGSVKAGSEEDIERLLAAAQEAGIAVHERTVLESAVNYSKEWLARAENLQQLTMEEQKLFLKAGEKVIYVQQRNAIAAELRAELKKAKAWKARFDKSGFDTGAAPAELLTELVEEAQGIRMNLTEYTDNIVQVNKTYCLCRMAYHGQMVGCDTCEEWYHFQCVGLSFSQAEKCAKYVCVRCSLKNSFSHSANLVAQLTNKWMNCAEHFRRRDEAFQKLSKKLYKEEKELLKARTTFKAAVDSIPASSLTPELSAALGRAVEEPPAPVGGASGAVPAGTETATSASTEEQDGEGSGSSESGSAVNVAVPMPVVNPATATLPTSTAEKVLAAKREVMAMQANVTKSLQEKEKLTQAITVETHLHREIFRWMSAMQELLWPGADEQKVALGRPVGPTAALPLHASVSVLEYNRSILSHLPSLLPVGLVHMEKAAALVGIEALDDVALALEAFRWMSWTNVCLHLLRTPPTTTALRRLLEAPKGMSMADDKIMKLLGGVLQRAVAWKVKARKTLTAQSKKLDLARLQNLALEGTSLPFTSRLKEKLKLILAAQPGSALLTEAPAGSDAAASKPLKRGPKPASGDNAGTVSATGESWVSRVVASGVEDCVSSDEEDNYERQVYAQHVQAQAQEGAMDVAMNVNGAYAHDYQPFPVQAMAVAPEPVWPVQLLVLRRKPVSGSGGGSGVGTGTVSGSSTVSANGNLNLAAGGAMNYSSAVSVPFVSAPQAQGQVSSGNKPISSDSTTGAAVEAAAVTSDGIPAALTPSVK